LESNWRYRVAERGMAKTGVRLAAWLLDSTSLITCFEDYAVTGYYQSWFYLDPDQDPLYVSNVPVPAEHPHFPFGLVVEPD